ncbi:MAG: TetR/AcrR family transcriptional regulator [Myxococcales bacterium]
MNAPLTEPPPGPSQPPPSPAMDDSPKGRILQAAAQLFVTRGFDRTTVRELAAAVGIQSGSLFHHFKSKEQILEAVMVAVIELNTGRMRAALERAPDPESKLRALIQCEVDSINGDTSEAMGLLVREWRSLPEDAQQRVLVLRDRYEQLFLDAIAAAGGELVDIDPFILRRFIYGIDFVSGYWFKPDGPLSTSDLVDLIMKLLRKKESP